MSDGIRTEAPGPTGLEWRAVEVVLGYHDRQGHWRGLARVQRRAAGQGWEVACVPNTGALEHVRRQEFVEYDRACLWAEGVAAAARDYLETLDAAQGPGSLLHQLYEAETARLSTPAEPMLRRSPTAVV